MSNKVMIWSGAALAVAALGWGIWFGGIFAVCAACGMYTGMRTIDLIIDDQ